MTIQDFQDRLCGYRPTLQQARAEFAVLVPLIERPDGLHLLYEVRAQNLRHHAAEVCFPGGRTTSTSRSRSKSGSKTPFRA